MSWQQKRVWRRYAEKQGWLVVAVVLLFWGAAIAGLTWLGFFNWRRLRMTDDFAAISSATLGALLLLCFVEFYMLAKKGVERMEAWKTAVEAHFTDPEASGSAAASGNSVLLDGVKNLMWMVAGGAALCALMGSDLVVVGVWAAVDEHGPARWLAWGTCAVVIVGIGAVLSYILLKMYLSFRVIAAGIAVGIGVIDDRAAGERFAKRYQAWLRDPENAPYHPLFGILRASQDRRAEQAAGTPHDPGQP
ncbi:hypothetical protein [Streptomyces sp. NBC_00063]|uniref:hypothetical protein n=1 Tax=Streptomyces sp. NBC_00063 TaxID=2975638 RepID=UPI002255E11D|nr:hypothetical protein [Streptomyces sp. NBC_00063]MCX5443905.1 hypothetical protein [Streptomyces sp. NBC_00063]